MCRWELDFQGVAGNWSFSPMLAPSNDNSMTLISEKKDPESPKQPASSFTTCQKYLIAHSKWITVRQLLIDLWHILIPLYFNLCLLLPFFPLVCRGDALFKFTFLLGPKGGSLHGATFGINDAGTSPHPTVGTNHSRSDGKCWFHRGVERIDLVGSEYPMHLGMENQPTKKHGQDACLWVVFVSSCVCKKNVGKMLV